MPVTDECTQDWTLLSAEVGADGLIFEVERALDTTTPRIESSPTTAWKVIPYGTGATPSMYRRQHRLLICMSISTVKLDAELSFPFPLFIRNGEPYYCKYYLVWLFGKINIRDV